METGDQRRKRKLADLCAEHGLAEVASKAGASIAYLDQILKGRLLPAKKDGSRSPRSLGDAVARTIEERFGLGLGWFDADETTKAKPRAAPPSPPPGFTDRLEVSPSDWAILQDVKDAVPADELADIRRRAIEFRARVNRAVQERMAQARTPTEKPLSTGELIAKNGGSSDRLRAREMAEAGALPFVERRRPGIQQSGGVAGIKNKGRRSSDKNKKQGQG
ncbi:hypothetical protein [Methylibium sp.]|uniref:hypothetical protein n=1 Tax=Methylibium sp. TaxID=2067992 RepID=UPI00179CA4EA|nr:hypothetical protein [Methylibium sp.]MBA3590362.1 hypothetical protein [Methylibium sp.]